MRTIICITAVAAMALAASTNAVADAEAGQGYFTVMGSYIDDDKARGLEDGINGGQFGIGYALNDNWNLQALVSIALPKGDMVGVPDAEHTGYGLELQRVFQRSERFSPYFHMGYGLFNNDPDGTAKRTDGAMISAGLGFLLDIASSNVALRAEWKHREDFALSRSRGDNLFSLGLQIPFGASTPKWVDSDGDGVEDGSDNCPNTRAGAKVDAWGCEIVIEPPRDSDGDGVIDDKDQCPGTPAGAAVDANGCELDDDGDGVVNRLDECPGTAPGVQVDIKGCEIKAEIKLEGVNFETNSDRLLPGATNILDDAVATLKKNPSIKVEVAGHTDSDGAAAYNEGLSARRAKTVHDYLAAHGIAVSRMTVRGYGESQPIADNSTAAGKAKNRRVVLRITER